MNNRVSAIAAVSAGKRAMGMNNKLLWRIPGDLPRLRTLTMGHPLIMGRKTMEHIGGKPLPGRTNIVVSRNATLSVNGFVMTGSVAEALENAKSAEGGEEVFVFGGAQIYTVALPYTQRLYLTIVHDEPPADAFFPDYSEFTKIVEKSEEMLFGEIKYQYITLEKP